MARRRRAFLAALSAEFLIIIAMIIAFGQTPSAPASQAIPTMPGKTPPSLLVVPEVPFGTIAMVLACFLALFVAALGKPKTKPS